MISAVLNITPDATLDWTWDELIERYQDAVDIEQDRFRAQAALMGVKLKRI